MLLAQDSDSSRQSPRHQAFVLPFRGQRVASPSRILLEILLPAVEGASPPPYDCSGVEHVLRYRASQVKGATWAPSRHATEALVRRAHPPAGPAWPTEGA